MTVGVGTKRNIERKLGVDHYSLGGGAGEDFHWLNLFFLATLRFPVYEVAVDIWSNSIAME